MLRRVVLLGALIAPLSVAPLAHAQEPEEPTEPEDENVAKARELAQTALERLEEKNYQEALEYAQKAEDLYHAPIHMRVMGQALEGMGRRAEAAAMYEKLVAEPLSPTAHPLFLESQRIGRARLKHLAAHLPSILVKVEGVKRSLVTVTIDDRKIETGPGVAVIVDAGKHVVKVEAPDRDPFEKEVTLPERGGVVVVEAPMFAEGEEPGGDDDDDDGAAGTSGPPVATWALLGVGGALLIGGGVIGTLVLVKASELEDACPEFRCPPSEESAHEQNVILGWTSTAALAAGGALVGAGFIVWAVSGNDDETEPAARLQIGPGSLTVRGRF